MGLVELARDSAMPRMKWEAESERNPRPDLLSLGTADMDFRSPQPMLDDLASMISKGHLGYPYADSSYCQVIRERLRSRYSWDVDVETSICHSAGVYVSAWNAIDILTQPGDAVTILTPVHFVFRKVITASRRTVIECPLLLEGDTYAIDYAALEAALASSHTLWLNNPHNPIGHAWKRDELERIAEICLRRGASIISDDVYSPLVFPGASYTPIASLSKEVSYRTITLYSPSKGYNTTGLKYSFAIAENPEHVMAMRESSDGIGLAYGLSLPGLVATVSACTKCDPWLDELMHLIKHNHDLFRRKVREDMPELCVTRADSTYFAWLDMRALRLPAQQIAYLLAEEEGLIVEDGSVLGKGGAGFIRINLATSEENINEALGRLGRFCSRRRK